MEKLRQDLEFVLLGEKRRCPRTDKTMKSRRDKKNVVGPLARISALMVNPLARFLVGERGELRFPEVNYIFCAPTPESQCADTGTTFQLFVKASFSDPFYEGILFLCAGPKWIPKCDSGGEIPL